MNFLSMLPFNKSFFSRIMEDDLHRPSVEYWARMKDTYSVPERIYTELLEDYPYSDDPFCDNLCSDDIYSEDDENTVKEEMVEDESSRCTRIHTSYRSNSTPTSLVCSIVWGIARRFTFPNLSTEMDIDLDRYDGV